MSLVDVHVIGGFDRQPVPENADYFVDGDEVLFPCGEAELYPDAEEFLRGINHNRLVVVSANPDSSLNKKRDDVVSPRYYVSPRSRLIPWSKYALYKEAATLMMEEETDSDLGVVVDDRWLMGSVVGKFALSDAGYNRTIAVFLDRGVEPNNLLDRSLAVLQRIGVQLSRTMELDELIRPRQ